MSILSSIQNGSSFIDAFQSYFIPSNILNKIICYTLEKELTTILKYFTLIFSFVQVVSNLSRASLKIKFSVKTIFISSVMATSNKKYTQMSIETENGSIKRESLQLENTNGANETEIELICPYFSLRFPKGIVNLGQMSDG